MIARIKTKLLTTFHDRVNPAWHVLNSMVAPGILSRDFDALDLVLVSLIVVVIAISTTNPAHHNFG